jgi:hypothetical protein
MVQVRYPEDILSIFPEPLSLEDAYSGTYQARVGFHDDCFLASFRSGSTFGRDRRYSIMMEYKYLSQLTHFVPVGGESCRYNPPRSDCLSALEELSLFHFSDLSDEWYPVVIDSWIKRGCFPEIKKKLGYRFSLISITSKEIVQPGETIIVDVSLENSGFASLINPRPVYFVLDGPHRYNIRAPIDPRDWSPGENSSFRVQIHIPLRAPEGEYKLALWLPDEYLRLRNDARYSIQFANRYVWSEPQGYNLLRTLDIDRVAQH